MTEPTKVPKWNDGSRWGQKGLVWGPVKSVPVIVNDPTVTYPVNEVIGFGSGTKQMLTKYQTQMVAAGVDPTALIAKLGTDTDSLSQENDKQEGLKTQEREQTTVVEGVKTTTYNDGSKACDMVITAFGRNSEEAQEAINLRKSVRPVSRSAAAKAAKAKTTP
jgi:hypothetical protein